MVSWDRWIRENVHCCACGAPLFYSKFINMVNFDKEAWWDYPHWNNILLMKKHPEKRALAIVCDDCIKARKEPVEAVEWNEGKTWVIYHPVKDLKDLPPITEEEVREADAKIVRRIPPR